MSATPTVLVADDHERTLKLHATLLERSGYRVEAASDGIEALSKVSLGIDAIVLDADMPRMDGFEVARSLRSNPDYSGIPILMVTGSAREADRKLARALDIHEYLEKPVEPLEFQRRTGLLLEARNAPGRESSPAAGERAVAMTILRRSLDEVTDAKRRLYDAHLDTIRRLTLAAECKDAATAGHIERIGLYSEVMGRMLDLTPSHVEALRHAAPMHDVGKLSVPDHILNKKGPLTDDEWVEMRLHTVAGARILEGSSSPILRLGEQIALTHHEHWDGGGYPHGIKGTEIPVEGRICAVVDFFDALTMDRPYRSAVDHDTVIDMLLDGAGSRFDPIVVETFMCGLDQILAIQREYL